MASRKLRTVRDSEPLLLAYEAHRTRAVQYLRTGSSGLIHRRNGYL